MFPLHPPVGPFLINTSLFGIPLAVRWYGVLIVGGAMVAGWISARRAERRGIDPEHIWNLLLFGMVVSIIFARAYYVAFEWKSFAGRPWYDLINTTKGGIAIHGALIGSMLSGVLYTWRNKLSFFQIFDISMPGYMLAQAIGRWGNFMNQEAYGRPTTLPFGVTIDADRRLPPYNDMATYPPATLFHATFLYESVWNVVGFGLLLWIERRLRAWRRTGDIGLFYAIWYGIGRLWIEGLRTDSLCTNGVGGSCSDALRTAQIVSILLIVGGLVGLYINHRRPITPGEAAAQQSPDGLPPRAAETNAGPEAPILDTADAAEASQPPSEPSPQAGL